MDAPVSGSATKLLIATTAPIANGASERLVSWIDSRREYDQYEYERENDLYSEPGCDTQVRRIDVMDAEIRYVRHDSHERRRGDRASQLKNDVDSSPRRARVSCRYCRDRDGGVYVRAGDPEERSDSNGDGQAVGQAHEQHVSRCRFFSKDSRNTRSPHRNEHQDEYGKEFGDRGSPGGHTL